MRVFGVLSLLLVLVPSVGSAQSLTSSVSVQAAAGPTLSDSGHNLSAAVGFTPLSRVTLFLDVQRTHLSSRLTRHERGFTAFRGGTMTAVSGEVRVGLWPVHRVTPYVLGGLGAGVSRPNVNSTFPEAVTNDARFMFFGGGVHVPLRERLSVFGDARMLIGAEGGELLAMAPVRVGLAWRF
jgi:hypothetical protein